MKIGIDISQIAYEKTGVANYLSHLVYHLVTIDKNNEYILFYSSLRNMKKYKQIRDTYKQMKKVSVKYVPIPPTLLDILWNRLHMFPIELFIGDINIFISSDWTEPPTKKAKKATILYDLIVYKYPEETARKIIEVQKRKLAWVKKEAGMVFCISDATKKDAQDILGIDEKKLTVIYPGI